MQYSDDGVTWDTAVYFGDTGQTTERTSDGTTYESAFFNMPSGNTTGISMGLGSIRVETRSA